MFTDKNENLRMLEGAYRKFKSYYYYNKSLIIMREKIAQFEYDKDHMQAVFDSICLLLSDPTNPHTDTLLDNIINKISFYVLPKKFIDRKTDNNGVSSNIISNESKLSTVNFFTDFPIEVYILDTLWTIVLGKVAYENSKISSHVYGNTLCDGLLYGNPKYPSGIDFDSLRLFNIYHHKYCDWRNRAFSSLEENYDRECNSILISLDIKSYFYSVNFDFDLISLFGDSKYLGQITSLTIIMEKVYKKYTRIVSPFISAANDSGHGYMLPIGLFSSMLIGNMYLCDFDAKCHSIDSCIYYGRYVDDLLFCFSTENSHDASKDTILLETLLKHKLIEVCKKDYVLSGKLNNLSIQKDKIKLLYISHNEPRAIFDIYNDTIKVIPSQMDTFPDYNFNLADFNESAYIIENFGSKFKIRDIGDVNVDAFNASRYFSTLVYRYINIDDRDYDSKREASSQIEKIREFFVGSRAIQHYTNWMNYMYFLVLCRRFDELSCFYATIRDVIDSISWRTLSTSTYNNRNQLCRIIKDSLLRYLTICYSSAISIDIEAITHGRANNYHDLPYMLMKSNMFNHSLVSLPLINYTCGDCPTSYTRMNVSRYGRIESNDAFKWSPRFVHFEEILLSNFFSKHNTGLEMDYKGLVDFYNDINHIRDIDKFNLNSTKEIVQGYILEKTAIPNYYERSKVATIAVGNVKVNEQDCLDSIKNRWISLNRNNKQSLRNILRESYEDGDKITDLLVLPELYVPVYWLKEVVEIAKKTQMAIVTGLKYMTGKDNTVKNYVATILPFRYGKQRYRHAFVSIREKNDYSPLEKEELAKIQKFCYDAEHSHYQIFYWKGLDISSFVCYELTDIFARALMKGKCDILAVPELNRDTTYFSNIIDSSVRDLHLLIVQSNNSTNGDSRITGPYDRDNKDIVKIKGGENSHTIIGKVDVFKILEYQAKYYELFSRRLDQIIAGERPDETNRHEHGQSIKKLSARFDTSRATLKMDLLRYVRRYRT